MLLEKNEHKGRSMIISSSLFFKKLGREETRSGFSHLRNIFLAVTSTVFMLNVDDNLMHYLHLLCIM